MTSEDKAPPVIELRDGPLPFKDIPAPGTIMRVWWKPDWRPGAYRFICATTTPRGTTLLFWIKIGHPRAVPEVYLCTMSMRRMARQGSWSARIPDAVLDECARLLLNRPPMPPAPPEPPPRPRRSAARGVIVPAGRRTRTFTHTAPRRAAVARWLLAHAGDIVLLADIKRGARALIEARGDRLPDTTFDRMIAPLRKGPVVWDRIRVELIPQKPSGVLVVAEQLYADAATTLYI